MVLEFRNQEASELDEVMIDDTDDVEAIGNDAGVGKVSLNKSSVGAGEIDADELNTVPAPEFTKEMDEVGFTATGLDFKDAMVFEITEGGAEALSFVKGVFVDAENQRALERDAFGGFASSELSVDALNGGLAESLSSRDRSGADPLVMLLEDGLAKGLGGVPSFHDPWEVGDEGSTTGEASESAGLDEQSGGFLEAIKMPDLAQISSFALKARGLAVRAAFGLKL